MLGYMSYSSLPPVAVPPVRSSHRRALRWLVPVGAAGVVALLASGVLSASANTNLAPRSAAQLLAAVGNSKVGGFSGTVVEKASLGLPELPDLGGSTSSGSANVLGLLSGSHTVRVWYAGENKQRVALLDKLGEQDVFRDGRQVWQWNSDTRTAIHMTLPTAADVRTPDTLPSITPDEAAQRALSLIEPSTTVTTDRAAVVAGRAAYVLVLTPKDSRSRISSVRISVDGKTMVPLGVQVYAKGSDRAAFDVAFTRFNDSVPSDDNFTWTPPPGATVKQAPATKHVAAGLPVGKSLPAGSSVSTIGSGWTTIVKVTGVPSLAELGKAANNTGLVLGVLPEVKGSWGTGRLFQSSLVTALITSDGRAFVGAVDPALLEQAAAAK
jgi:outer membrane lipoprotein-sorting protein